LNFATFVQLGKASVYNTLRAIYKALAKIKKWKNKTYRKNGKITYLVGFGYKKYNNFEL